MLFRSTAEDFFNPVTDKMELMELVVQVVAVAVVVARMAER